ncbi:MAG: DNA polymerase [bacterium]
MKKADKSQSKINPTESKRLVLLDAHAILHRAYHALPDFASSKGEPTGALYGVSAMLIKIIQDLKPDYLVSCYDLPEPTYRHQAYEEYKAGRKKADPELVAQMIRSRDIFTAFDIPMYDKPGFEADDMLGTIVEKMKENKDVAIVIASGDMDTLQLVDNKKVQVFTLKKGINDTIMYDEKAVLDRFGFLPKLLPDFKGLRGDPSDNIIGIAGIGEKTATTLIREFGTIEEIYKKLKKDKEAFKKVGVTDRIIELLVNGEEEAQFSKMLATIRRDAPIDFVLPEKTWTESLSVEKVIALFNELEFRTLGTRLKEVVGGSMKYEASGTEGKSEAKEKEILPEISESEFRPISIALWLINSEINNPKLEDILNFARTDSFEKAKEVILSELKKRNLEKVFEEIEKPLIPVVAKMHDDGIKVDTKFLKDLSEKYHKQLSEYEESIWEMAGENFNINSPKQLGVILFDKLALAPKNQKKTAGGAKSTKESELEKLREVHPIIEKILEYRELQKLLSTYIDAIPKSVAEDGRLHATFLQAGAATGRMASHDPNLQNIPIKSALGQQIRHAFIAEKGNSLAAIDYSQIELRIAAFLSGDEKLIEIFKKGEDVHTAVAAQVFKVSEKEVTKEMRRQAKVINFGILYGMGVNALRANLGTDRATAQNFYNEYFSNFSGLATYLDKVKVDTERIGYTETFFGRRRYFAGIKSKLPFIRAMAERMAINAPIQGTEADIVKLAMIQISKYISDNKLEDDVKLLLQVHDELVFEIKNESVKKIVLELQRIMEEVVDPKKISGIVCKAESSVGDNWGSMEDLTS